eukprot:UN08062
MTIFQKNYNNKTFQQNYNNINMMKNIDILNNINNTFYQQQMITCIQAKVTDCARSLTQYYKQYPCPMHSDGSNS